MMPHTTFRVRHARPWSILAILAALVGLSGALPPRAVRAAAIAVTTTADELNADGDCALREAIVAANQDQPVDACPAGNGADVITLPAGTYTLTIGGIEEQAAATGDLDLTASLTLTGAGAAATIIDGGALDRVVEVLGSVTIRITGVTIRNGAVQLSNIEEGLSQGGGLANHSGTVTIADSHITANDSGAALYGGNLGGGIYNAGALTLQRSAVTANRVPGGFFGGSLGAGIFNSGTLEVIDSRIAENIAFRGGFSESGGGAGGGIANRDGTTTIRGSTISGNIAYGGGSTGGAGGGLYHSGGSMTLANSTVSGNLAGAESGQYVTSGGTGGGIFSRGRLTIVGSTIAQNSAAAGDSDERGVLPGTGGGIFHEGAQQVTLRRTILAGNLALAGTGNDCAGALVAQGFNLLGDAEGCRVSGTTDGTLIGVEPRLAALADNGGPTPTHALLPGSPAIDAGLAACDGVDQRGVTRPQDGDGDGTARCDIGAVEQRERGARIAVTTTADELNADGDCALREAIVAANRDQPVDACPAGQGADWITLPAGSYALSIAGTREDAAATGDLDLTADVVISGAGAAATIIDGGALDRVVEVLAPAVVHLEGVRIQNGSTDEEDSGGGIRSWGTLVLHTSVVADNTTRAESTETGDRRGGGIANLGQMTLRGSTVRDNTIRVADGDSSGGGIYNTGRLLLYNSTISGNAAFRGWGGAAGGGVFSSGVLLLYNSTTSGNRALFGGGIHSTDQALVYLRRSTLAANIASGSHFYDNGGGILNNGLMRIDRSIIRDNRSYFGGGVAHHGGIGTIVDTTISGNSGSGGDYCCLGGGIANYAYLWLHNTTVSGNTAQEGGAGIVNGGELGYGTLALNNVTIANNQVLTSTYASPDSGGLLNLQGFVAVQNSLLAHNTALGTPADCGGDIFSFGTNLIQSTQDCTLSTSAPGDLIGVDPRLGPLADNGGPTPTHALLPGSPAIDAGSPNAFEIPGACMPFDQRGVARPQDGDGDGTARCDIGAFERAVRPGAARITGITAACDFDEYQPGEQVRATITIEIRDGPVTLDALVADLEGVAGEQVSFAPDRIGQSLAPGSYSIAATFRAYTPGDGPLHVIVNATFDSTVETARSAPLTCGDQLPHHLMLPMITK